MANKRVFYAIKQAGFAPLGSTTFNAARTIHGLQSIGINTRFNLENISEIGQLALYANLEGTPDVEVTLEKCLDGKTLIFHIASENAPTASLNGRSSVRSNFAMSIFSDQQDSASGMPLSQVYCSGMFVSAVSYRFPVEGPSRESVTMVGNNKLWITATGSITYTGQFDNTDTPANYPPIGISLRQHLVFGTGAQLGGTGQFLVNPCILPIDVDGISAGGFNILQSDGSYAAHIQNITASVNLGRESLFELGHKAAYWRFVNYPVEVRCDIEVLTSRGDMTQGTEDGILGYGNNLAERTIFISTLEGTKVDLGTKNKLQSATYGGANAGARGGNGTVTYSFITYNDFTITHPADITTALAA